MFRGKKKKYEDEEGELTLQSALSALGKDMAGGARANRVAEGKSNGLIVDYIGIVNALRKWLLTP